MKRPLRASHRDIPDASPSHSSETGRLTRNLIYYRLPKRKKRRNVNAGSGFDPKEARCAAKGLISRCVWRTDIVLLWPFAYGNTSSFRRLSRKPSHRQSEISTMAAGQHWGYCLTVDQPREKENVGRVCIVAVRKI
jgi:hypothetical protein